MSSRSTFGAPKISSAEEMLQRVEQFLQAYKNYQEHEIARRIENVEKIDGSAVFVASIQPTPYSIAYSLEPSDLEQLLALAQPNVERTGEAVSRIVDGYQKRIRRQVELMNNMLHVQASMIDALKSIKKVLVSTGPSATDAVRAISRIKKVLLKLSSDGKEVVESMGG